MTGLILVVVLLGQFGPADSLEAVRFEGNGSFASSVLAGVVTARKGQMVMQGRLANDARIIESFYEQNGFRFAQAHHKLTRGQAQWQVTFVVREGPRSRVGSVAITGNRAWPASDLLGRVGVKPGDVFTADSRFRAEEALTALYADNGYPFVQVAGSWEFADTLAALTFDIDEGPRCHVSAVRVRGSQSVSTRIILRTAEIRPGELCSRRRLRDAQRRLYATRLFRRVLFYVLRHDSLSDSVVVRFDVAEQPHRGFLFGVGFETPPWRLLGSLGWEHANLFNRGHGFEVNVEISPSFTGDYRGSVDASYRLPFVFGNRINLTFHPFAYLEQKDTLLRREYGAETGLSRDLTPDLSVGLFNRLRLVADTASGITNALGVNLVYDTRNDVFDPTRGVYLRPFVEVAGGLLQGDNDFYRVSGEARWFQDVGWDFVIAARALAGSTFPYGSTDRVPYYEAFRLGGRNSLRGYDDRSLGPDSAGVTSGERYGPMVLNANLELRSPYIAGWVGLVGFADAGEVVGPETGFTAGDMEYSAGVGVRVRTPIGPVRFDWGKRLKNPPEGDGGRFYLGLLHAF